VIGTDTRVRPVTVRAEGWGWRYAGRRLPAVRSVDLRIEPGEKVLLLGASGSGKSTLLAALAGVLGDEDDGSAEGVLRLDGRSPDELRGRAGLVLQDPDSQVVLARVGDDVAFGCENLGVAPDEIWSRVRAALDAVGLDVPLDFPTAALSGGQKQRLALAGVLAMRPGLVLLDEPTANLDPDGVREVRDAVERAVAVTGATLVVIEHRVEVWAGVVDRVVVLGAAEAGGGVIADGPAEQVLAAEGDRLAAGGVWVPGHLPAPPVRSHAAAAGPLLQAEGLSVGRNGVAVARGIDTEVRSGRLLGIRGRNGSGKTTLALTLAGLLPPVDGTLRSTEALSAGARPEPIRWTSRQLLGRIGTVFQDPEHQLLTGTVRDELEVGPRAQGLRGADLARRVDPLLERLRLSRLAAANPFTLSGGEKRRLSVATILAAEPRVLVLDEPTFGQDARTWAELVALLAGLLDRGLAAVAVTHDEHFLDALADESLVLGR
jgi:energy-coupling factor transporter ATP-binding protein EcfA2